LQISESSLQVQLFGYKDHFHIKTDAPVHLLAETGEYVSLHSCIDGGSGFRSGYDGKITTQDIIANVAVVGPDHWTETDLIKRVSFSVKHTMDLMRSLEHMKGIGRAEYPREEHLRLFTDKAKGINIGASYRGIWGMDFQTPKQLWPIFEIEFDEPRDIHAYIEHVTYCVHFLSFCMGVPLRPTDISIQRLSLKEIMKTAEENTYRRSHEVHYVWPETEIDSTDLWVGGSPALAQDEEELAAFRACLIAWMNRADVWFKPYAMMMSSLKLKGETSAERLLSACKWFEELPNAKSDNALSTKDTNAIVAAAISKAEELGKANLGDRIATSISRIKEETAAARFKRLIDMVEVKFGKGILPDNAMSHLKNANKFRGQTAHGHFTPANNEEFRAFSKAIRAMEALCVLLTAIDLPIAQSGISRIASNPPLRDYRNAYE
jgi:ApeA N-terminal domain 1